MIIPAVKQVPHADGCDAIECSMTADYLRKYPLMKAGLPTLMIAVNYWRRTVASA